MRWHHRLYVALRGLLGPSALDRELSEELQFHFDRQVQANINRGMPHAEARRAAAIAIGNLEPIREASRDGRSGTWLRQFGRDLSYGARLLLKAPGFSAAAIAIVALGVGAVTAIFSVVYGVALKPLPFHEPERLVNISSTASRLGPGRFLINGADHRDWLAANHVFEDIALYRNVANFNLIGAGEPERLQAARIAANLMPILGVSPVIGRGFTEQEDEIGHEQVVILSDAFWRRRFSADPSIVGKAINLSGAMHTVVGVMGPEFQYPGREFQIWTPLTINPNELARKEPGNNHLAVARLKPGVSVADAQAEMSAIAARIATANPRNEMTGVAVLPMHADLLANVQAALYAMLGAVLCLLLVAALNLSTLLSARGAARSRELAVRLALGATRGRVALQSIAEIVPLLAIGGALGIGLAAYAVALFIPLAPPTLPRVENIQVSVEVLIASLAVLSLTGLAAALLPAAQAWRADLTTATREDARSSFGSARQSRARSVLVVAQIALALPLLVGGGLLARTFTRLNAENPGFNAENVLSMHLAIPRSKYRSDTEVARVVGRFHERAKQVPGVVSAGMVNRLPLAGGAQVLILEFNAPRQLHPDLATIDARVVTPDYFKTMGIPLMEGRDFNDADTETAPQAGLIDERVARLMWPGESAVGKRFRYSPKLMPGQEPHWIEIVGVVGHVRHDGMDVDPRTQVYWPYQQRAQDRMALVVRGSRDATALTASVVAGIHDVDPDQPVYDVRTMDQWVARSLSQRWMNMTLVGSFAVVALALCSIGIYGVIAFGVARQRREFGIRLALGASKRGITAAVVKRGLTLVAIGLAAGLAFAAVVSRSMTSLLFEVDATDAISFGSATLAIISVAVLASYLPARRAAAVDPAVTLRTE
jgi:putative ABC transport system permease protein